MPKNSMTSFINDPLITLMFFILVLWSAIHPHSIRPMSITLFSIAFFLSISHIYHRKTNTDSYFQKYIISNYYVLGCIGLRFVLPLILIILNTIILIISNLYGVDPYFLFIESPSRGPHYFPLFVYLLPGTLVCLGPPSELHLICIRAPRPQTCAHLLYLDLENCMGVVQRTGAGSLPRIFCVVSKSDSDHGMATMATEPLG